MERYEVAHSGELPRYLNINKFKFGLVKFANGFPCAKFLFIDSIDEVAFAIEKLKFPMIVKPPNSHNSLDITKNSVCNSKEELE